jgi:hypothetical protein
MTHNKWLVEDEVEKWKGWIWEEKGEERGEGQKGLL